MPFWSSDLEISSLSFRLLPRVSSDADPNCSKFEKLFLDAGFGTSVGCGSNRLIEEFLRMENLEAELIVAKELIIENGKIRGMIRHINSIEDKAKAIEAIRTTWPGCTIIAVGDGPTDAHMLSLADYPFVISWNGKRRLEGYEIIDSFDRIEEKANALMERKE